MSPFDSRWQKLVALARQAPADPRDETAPLGFATRVVARAAGRPATTGWALLGHLAVRGLLVAAACGIAAVALNYSVLTSDQSVDYAVVDSVGDLLDFS
ncbi:MAG TPA: hypothetical protein VHD61_00525 [Lacunisphaera sp.]|nr:hypothetical protein [Lacunisphaera sp.]